LPVSARYLICTALLGFGLTAARAQQTASTSTNYLQTAPIYNFAGNPYAQGAPPAALLPPGALALVPQPLPLESIGPNFASHVHGFVSGGISTHGGDDLAAGVLVPLVPGRLDLAVSANTGQFGVQTYPGGGKQPTLRYNGYQATLDLHPSPDFDASVTISGTNIRGPYATGYHP